MLLQLSHNPIWCNYTRMYVLADLSLFCPTLQGVLFWFLDLLIQEPIIFLKNLYKSSQNVPMHQAVSGQLITPLKSQRYVCGQISCCFGD